jgi:DNA-binding PadR family transcriptional regulator
MSDNLPPLSHLQFAVLDVLGTNTMAGKHLRENLAANGIKKSGPSFYQLMARLEEAKLVEGRIDQKIVDSQIIKERFYKVTGEGSRALQAQARFYQSRITGLTPSFI